MVAFGGSHAPEARGGGGLGGGEARGRLGELARRTGGDAWGLGCERAKAARRGPGRMGGHGAGAGA